MFEGKCGATKSRVNQKLNIQSKLLLLPVNFKFLMWEFIAKSNAKS